MWLKTTEGYVLNSEHIAAFELMPTVDPPEGEPCSIVAILTVPKPSRPTVAEFETYEEAVAALEKIRVKLNGGRTAPWDFS